MTRDIEKYEKDYTDNAHNFEKYQVKYRRKKILEILEQYRPKNILEIGCGTEPIFDYYSEFDEFTTIEPVEDFVSHAVKLADGNECIEVIKGYLHDKVEYLKSKNFDFIICSSLLHELESPQELLQDICELCSKETIVHINVPNSRSFHLLWAKESDIHKLDELTPTAQKFQQHTSFNIEKLTKMVENLGLEVIDKDSYFVKPFNHAKMKQLVEQKIIDDKLIEGLYYMTQYMPELGSEIYVNCRLK